MRILSFNEMCEFINIAISTSTIQSLKTPYAEIRPQLHCIIAGDIGTLKSSLLYQVADHFDVGVEFNLNPAHLLGSVDKTTGAFNTPVIWDCRNSVMCVDEFECKKEGNTRQAVHTLLPLLERAKINKRSGYRINGFKEEDGDLYLIADNGKIKINTRFVYLATTMQDLWKPQRMIELEALRTRCIILPYFPGLEELEKRISGQLLFKPKRYKLKKNIRIPKPIYEKIVKMVKEKNVLPKFFVRTIGDVCRIFAVKKSLSDDTIKILLEMREKSSTYRDNNKREREISHI